jgi:hypothetical protein
MEGRSRRRELHASGSAEADGDLAAFDDDRNAALSGELDHPVEPLLVRLDVDVGERDLPLRVVLTGRGRVGSGVLPENLDAVGAHRRPPPAILTEAGCYDFWL